jgi:predicted O-linked N-acetylglucosamine transferase (SPINDLY family)
MNSPDIQRAFELGLAHHQAGRLNEAERIYRQILAREPGHADALHLLGVIGTQTGRHELAVELIRRALTVRPRWPEAMSNLGAAHQAGGQLDDAIAAYRAVVALNPGYVDGRYNLGNALKLKGEFDEAIACFEWVLSNRPDDLETRSILLFISHYLPSYDPAVVAEMHRQWNRVLAKTFKSSIGDHETRAGKEHPNDPDRDRKLKIGYVSPDLRDHPVGRFLLPLLESHDQSRFEIFAYALNSTEDWLTLKLRGLVNHWRSFGGISDAQAAEQIRQDRIDILIDLAGHTAGSRLMIFARKPAPVQATYLGYPDTTGLTGMDYRLTDRYADPTGIADSFHSEKLIRLSPCAWCFKPAHRPAIQSRETGPITFGCFNAFAKITQPMMRIWSDILRALPDSRMMLKSPGMEDAGIARRFLKMFEELGIGANRVQLRGREPDYAAHLNLYREIDIALDTFPYHGTTTTCEALWMGVPVIALAGQGHVSRVGVSLLSNAGLAELIANDPAEYVRIAVSLANDRPRLDDLRMTLRPRLEASPLMNAARFAREFESSLRLMWQAWCGEPRVIFSAEDK